MRKLKLQMQTSIDGLVATGPNDQQQWVTWALQDIHRDVLALLDSIDTILIGRKLAVDYIPFWLDTVKKPDDPMQAFAQRIVAARKIVFSRTLDASRWDNTTIARGDLAEEVKALKGQPGKDLIVYGGAQFVSALVGQGLIDEFHFFVNPVALGKGLPIFDKLAEFRPLKLTRSVTYPSGILLLSYEAR